MNDPIKIAELADPLVRDIYLTLVGLTACAGVDYTIGTVREGKNGDTRVTQVPITFAAPCLWQSTPRVYPEQFSSRLLRRQQRR